MHLPLPFMVYPDSKYLAIIRIFPWNLPNLLKQCRSPQSALSEAHTGVSMLMHISSPGYPMALLVFQTKAGCMAQVPPQAPSPSRMMPTLNIKETTPSLRKSQSGAAKYPEAVDSKAQRDLGSHKAASFRKSCASHFGKAFSP